jgi:solute carrier family 8 (sodium/calcium exchanger)
MIGVLTAFIGDLATHFGCTIGLKDSITAIVFISLGTSAPGMNNSHLDI